MFETNIRFVGGLLSAYALTKVRIDEENLFYLDVPNCFVYGEVITAKIST